MRRKGARKPTPRAASCEGMFPHIWGSARTRRLTKKDRLSQRCAAKPVKRIPSRRVRWCSPSLTIPHNFNKIAVRYMVPISPDMNRYMPEATSPSPQGPLEQGEDTLVFVGPTGRLGERVVLNGIDGELPVLFAQLDEPLDQAHGVVELNVGIHHAVTDEECALQPVGEENGGRAPVSFRVALWQVQDFGSVAVVVERPIGNRPQGRAGGEGVALGEHGHQGEKAAVTATPKADFRRVGAVAGHQVMGGVGEIVEVLAAHMPVDRGSPVAPIAGRAAVIDIDDDEAALHQQVIEQVLAVIVGAPPAVHVLQVPGAVDKHHAGSALAKVGGLEQARRHLDSVARGECDNWHIEPRVGGEIGRGECLSHVSFVTHILLLSKLLDIILDVLLDLLIILLASTNVSSSSIKIIRSVFR